METQHAQLGRDWTISEGGDHQQRDRRHNSRRTSQPPTSTPFHHASRLPMRASKPSSYDDPARQPPPVRGTITAPTGWTRLANPGTGNMMGCYVAARPWLSRLRLGSVGLGWWGGVLATAQVHRFGRPRGLLRPEWRRTHGLCRYPRLPAPRLARRAAPSRHRRSPNRNSPHHTCRTGDRRGRGREACVRSNRSP